MQGVKASAYDPVRKLWTTEGELVSSRESLFAIGGMRAETRFRQGVQPNAQPPRIQVALATGKLVLPEQGCLGQGGCEAKPDYEGVEANAYDPVCRLRTTEGAKNPRLNFSRAFR